MKDQLHLHFIVLLFGFTGILGKLISLPATELVWYRMLLAALGMGVVVRYLNVSLRLPTRSVLEMCVVGLVIALHWIAFFAAIKVSNVSVALGCMASTTLFTSFLEPLFDKRRIYWIEVVLGAIIVLGLYIITQFAFHYYWGIIYALISAFLASLFGVINKQFVDRKYEPTVISFYEMSAGFVGITLYTFANTNTDVSFTWPLSVPSNDWIYLMLLAWLCTTYAFVATVYLLKRLSPYTISLAINMEPVYAIIFAYLIFGESEQMSLGFYIGAVIILLAIVAYPFLKKRFVKS